MTIKGALDGNVTEYLFINHNIVNGEREFSGKIVYESDKDGLLIKLYDDVEESVKRVEDFIAHGSGHAFVKTSQVMLTVVTFNPYKTGTARVIVPSFYHLYIYHLSMKFIFNLSHISI